MIVWSITFGENNLVSGKKAMSVGFQVDY